MKLRLFLVAITLVTGTVGSAAQDVDLPRLKRDSQVLERIVSEVLKQNFSNPFALEAEPQAAFLPGYGIVLSFNLKINRAVIRLPFGTRTIRREARSKPEQIETVKQAMIQVLADYGNTIKQMNGSDRIAICGHIEDRNELDPIKNQTVLILSVTKEDIDLYNMKKLSLSDFSDRVRIVEY